VVLESSGKRAAPPVGSIGERCANLPDVFNVAVLLGNCYYVVLGASAGKYKTTGWMDG